MKIQPYNIVVVALVFVLASAAFATVEELAEQNAGGDPVAHPSRAILFYAGLNSGLSLSNDHVHFAVVPFGFVLGMGQTAGQWLIDLRGNVGFDAGFVEWILGVKPLTLPDGASKMYSGLSWRVTATPRFCFARFPPLWFHFLVPVGVNVHPYKEEMDNETSYRHTVYLNVGAGLGLFHSLHNTGFLAIDLYGVAGINVGESHDNPHLSPRFRFGLESYLSVGKRF